MPALAAFHFELDTIVLLDELAQLYMKGGITIGEADEYEFSSQDDAMFDALGSFGFEADRYNEQVLSYDFYSIIEPATPIGSVTAMEVSEWLVS